MVTRKTMGFFFLDCNKNLIIEYCKHKHEFGNPARNQSAGLAVNDNAVFDHLYF